jgi:hypothetical protein
MQINISIILAPPWFSSCIRHYRWWMGGAGRPARAFRATRASSTPLRGFPWGKRALIPESGWTVARCRVLQRHDWPCKALSMHVHEMRCKQRLLPWRMHALSRSVNLAKRRPSIHSWGNLGLAVHDIIAPARQLEYVHDDATQCSRTGSIGLTLLVSVYHHQTSVKYQDQNRQVENCHDTADITENRTKTILLPLKNSRNAHI